MRNIIIALLYPALMLSQTDSKYMDYRFEGDSLVLSGGVNPREYSFPVAEKKTIFDYELFAIMDDPQSKTPHPLRHWMVPIIVYVDPAIDRRIKKDFQAFVNSFPVVDNLSIEITTKRAQANYFITYTDQQIIDRNKTYTGITYQLLTDYRNKIYAATLAINPGQITTNEEQMRRLRLFFFNSLGQFCILSAPENSLFSEDYAPSGQFSAVDTSVLRFHYNFINDNPVTADIFKKLVRAYSKINKPAAGKVKIILP